MDSQSALLALNCKNPMDNDVVNGIKNLVCSYEESGCKIKFFWVPSHIGIYLNECADRLAKEATEKPVIDIRCKVSLNKIKKEMKYFRNIWVSEHIENLIREGSYSLRHYLYVTANTNISYGKSLSKVDTFNMRMRLGYRYCWEYINDDGIPCRLCGQASSHTLEHYVLECSQLTEYRDVTIVNILDQICHMLNNEVSSKIVKKFPNF